MILTTYSEKIDENYTKVYWFTGPNNKGIYKVKNFEGREDSDVIAELVVIRHLVLKVNALKKDIISGFGTKLIVSKGAIKKMINGKSTKEHILIYGDFLSKRLDGVGLEVNTQKSTYVTFENTKENYLSNELVIREPLLKVMFPSIGEVSITPHAVHRYTERNATGTPKNPWKSIIDCLKSSKITKLEIPQKQLEYKNTKYGDQSIEMWGVPKGTMRYLIVKNGRERVLVTAFSIFDIKRDYDPTVY